MKHLYISLAAMTASGIIYSAPVRADTTPECNTSIAADTTECGADSMAGGAGATAVGDTAIAAADQSTAVGSLADATALGAQAFGYDADASAQLALAVGHMSDATNTRATAVGTRANAGGLHATALGTLTNAAGMGATAIGNGASASNAGTVAVGVRSVASADFATAIGRRANASAINATALGADTVASFDGATALGFGAMATAANQVALGGAGSHTRIGDIAASTSAQDVSSIGLATVDANGVLGRNSSLLPTIGQLQNSVFDLAQLSDDLRRDVRAANEGIAMALALDSPNIPSGSSFAMSGGIGHFKGRTALALAISAMVNETASVSAGIGYGFDSKDFGTRAGFQIAW